MRMTPDEVSQLIVEIANRAASSRSIQLSSKASDRLAVPTPQYSVMSHIDVDMNMLEKTIVDLIEGLANSITPAQAFIDIDVMNDFLSWWPCHYLWLC